MLHQLFHIIDDSWRNVGIVDPPYRRAQNLERVKADKDRLHRTDGHLYVGVGIGNNVVFSIEF